MNEQITRLAPGVRVRAYRMLSDSRSFIGNGTLVRMNSRNRGKGTEDWAVQLDETPDADPEIFTVTVFDIIQPGEPGSEKEHVLVIKMRVPGGLKVMRKSTGLLTSAGQVRALADDWTKSLERASHYALEGVGEHFVAISEDPTVNSESRWHAEWAAEEMKKLISKSQMLPLQLED